MMMVLGIYLRPRRGARLHYFVFSLMSRDVRFLGMISFWRENNDATSSEVSSIVLP